MFYNIPTKNIFTIKDYKKVNLTKADQEILFKSLELINEQLEKNILILYRGMKMKNQLDRLNATTSDEIFNKLFMLGDKASNYYNDKHKLDNFLLDERNYLLDINDISDNTFKFIFNEIKNNLDEENVKFKNYFINNTDESFIQCIKKLSDKEKLRIRDYYYAYLHTDGKLVNKFSHYISTTKNYSVANRFSNGTNTRPENKLIFSYILKKPYIDFAIYSRNAGYLGKLCSQKGLPIYKAKYLEEDEISVKGGLFPHFIFGIECIEHKRKYFIVNPYLFEENFDIRDITTKGFPINQEYFEDVIKTTNYKSFSTVYEDGCFEQTYI